jgi:transcriptional regulator with XRE-family HTH domain
MQYSILGYLPRPEYYGAVPKAKATQVDGIFRESLKELRLAKKLTQAQVAGHLGQPQSYVSKYETGERRLDFVETVFVCEALGTSVEEFAAAFARRLTKVRRAKVS